MAQVNFHTTPDFEKALAALMKARGLKSRSEAIRTAVQEAAEPYIAESKRDVDAVHGLLKKYLGGRAPALDSRALQDEIDREMDAKLDRLSRR